MRAGMPCSYSSPPLLGRMGRGNVSGATAVSLQVGQSTWMGPRPPSGGKQGRSPGPPTRRMAPLAPSLIDMALSWLHRKWPAGKVPSTWASGPRWLKEAGQSQAGTSCTWSARLLGWSGSRREARCPCNALLFLLPPAIRQQTALGSVAGNALRSPAGRSDTQVQPPLAPQRSTQPHSPQFPRLLCSVTSLQ